MPKLSPIRAHNIQSRGQIRRSLQTMMSRRAVLLLNRRFSRLRIPPSPPNRISFSPSSSSTIARFFSSKGDFSSENNPIARQVKPTATVSPKDDALIASPKDAAPIRKPKDDASSDASVVSTEGLKSMIGTYMAGNMEILPDIFEAILERKMSGKHEEADHQLMEELRSKMPNSSELVEEEEEDLSSGDDCDSSDEDSDYDSD